MNSKTVTFCICLLFNYIATAQNALSVNQIDSVFNVTKFKVACNPEQTFIVFKKLYNESLKKNHKIGISFSLIGMGKSVGYLTNYKEALAYTNKGRQIAKEIDNDSLLLYADYVTSLQYGHLGLNAKAISLIDDCFERVSVLKCKNSKNLMLGTLYTNKAILSEELKQKPSDETFLFLHRKAFYHYAKVNRAFSNPSFNNLGRCFDKLNQLDSAKFYFQKGVAFAKYSGKTPEIEFSSLAKLNIKLKSYNVAKQYLDSSIVICKNKKAYNLLADNYEAYKQLYSQLGDTNNAITAQDFVYRYKDSAYAFNKSKISESVNYLLDTMVVENESLIKVNRYFLIGFAIVFFVLCFITGCFYFKKENFKNASSHKENELAAKSNEIVELKHKVSTSYNELIEMAKKNDPLFLPFFIELYPELHNKLIAIQPNLTLTEQKICFYIKLKFSSKEIAGYTFVTVKAIQNRKNRLRKRLNIESGVDIYDWFERL